MTREGVSTLMLVDDEPAQRRLVSALAARAGWRTVMVNDAEAALAALDSNDTAMVDAVIIDQWSPSYDVGELIESLRSRQADLPILILTANNDVAEAVKAMRAGATDYLSKPIAPERFLGALNATLFSETDLGELRPLTEKISAPLSFEDIVGATPQFRTALAIAAKAARSRLPILIEGEDGVGKDVVARAIHAASPRHKHMMITVNCGVISANLIESELFGHERGAFTGAFDRQIGKFAHADMGTLFLDEVSEIPFDAQKKLLRVLQDGEVHPLGARRPIHVDVRIIAASNKDLAAEVEAGRFREDLYYRLNIVQLTVPPLRDRSGDVPALARHLLSRLATQPGLRSLGLTGEALDLLVQYEWPGNVRQLQNVLFRAAISCEGDALTVQDFPQIARQIEQKSSSSAISLRPTLVAPSRRDGAGVTLFEDSGHIRQLADIEADVIRLAIGHYRGRMTEVARRLGIGRSTLYRKLAELGIDSVAS